MFLLNRVFKKKKPVKVENAERKDIFAQKYINWGAIKDALKSSLDIQTNIYEPFTLAKARLEKDAKDIGAVKGKRMYNAHMKRVNNQWINAYQSINTGNGTAQLSGFNYQTVNYYECYALAQDPLFAKIFNILSETTFAKGGKILGIKEDEQKALDKIAYKYNLIKELQEAVRSSFVSGGCLLYMDFGDSVDLEEPLDLNAVDITQFKGFRHIDPINITAVDVETVNPASADYMEPKKWYVIGLGVCDKSHFLKFEANVPELVMKPLCLYFGMPLTQLIKQDVANSNLASQGLANLVNRFRLVYHKLGNDAVQWTPESAVAYRDRLEAMSLFQDNQTFYPLMQGEDVTQLTTSLAGFSECVKMPYQIISAKTSIPFTRLFGGSADGMNATGEGDRKDFYDTIRNIQSSIKSQLLTALGIISGLEDGKFKVYDDYEFANLEAPDEKEKAENLKSIAEVAEKLISLGGKAEDVFDWVKGFKEYNLDKIQLDTDTDGLEAYGDNPNDITADIMAEYQKQSE